MMQRMAFINGESIDNLNAFRDAHRSDVDFNHQKMLEMLDRLDKYTGGQDG